MANLFSYVVDHDYGVAPNPFNGYCTLAECKWEGDHNILQMAKKGDWIVGTGGANLSKSAGNGKLIYAMRVDEKLSLKNYCCDSRFKERIDAKHHTRGRWRSFPTPNISSTLASKLSSSRQGSAAIRIRCDLKRSFKALSTRFSTKNSGGISSIG